LNNDEDVHRHIKGQRAYKSIRAQDKEIYEDPKLEIIILCQKYKNRLYILCQQAKLMLEKNNCF